MRLRDTRTRPPPARLARTDLRRGRVGPQVVKMLKKCHEVNYDPVRFARDYDYPYFAPRAGSRSRFGPAARRGASGAPALRTVQLERSLKGLP